MNSRTDPSFTPVPTIAAINGHCYAGGFMLSLACDYRVMTDGTSRNAWLCMNEVSLVFSLAGCEISNGYDNIFRFILAPRGPGHLQQS